MEDDHGYELTENSIKVLERRYLKKNDKGELSETPDELFRRVAKAIAEPDKKFGASPEEVQETEDKFYKIISSLEFMPNSPTLMNAGRPLGQLSACFVLPIGDSMESIFDAVKHTALIHKSGGGTGFAFSRLRPRNSMVASTSGVASGPVSFMKVINSATEAVKQGGTRRGANMGVLRVDHPDIMEFISCKDNLSELTNFNISVAVTDEFMRAAREDAPYELKDPRTGEPFVKDGSPVHLNAKVVLDDIVSHAHRTGEPGIIFLDRMNDGNPVTKVALYEATNPCGEQPLLPYESCNLGSINLSKMIKAVVDLGSPRELSRYEIDWEKLDRTVRTCVHFLDNVIEANKYPLPEIDSNTKENRKIGLGVMGWADLLIMMNIPYNSQEAIDLAEKVMSRINNIARDQSSKLSETRGVFPNWEKSHFYKGGEGKRMRNSTVTTIAPTGTISIISGCSSGVEPLFAISFVRNVMDQTKLIEVNPYFERVAKSRGFYSKELMEKISETNSIAGYNEITADVKRIFVTTHDINPEWHVRMQAAFQKFTDNAVSKTINLPSDATEDDVRKAYEMAFDLKCKGITIYRDGSRSEQVLSTKATSDPNPKTSEKSAARTAKPSIVEDRPDILNGITEKIKTGYGNLYVTVNLLNNRPFEVFASIGKSGYSTMADTEAICRLISLALRSGVPVSKVTEQLKGIGGSSPVFGNGGLISSIPDAIAQVLHKHFGNGDKIEKELDLSEEFCPDCNSRIQHDGGCIVCASCGYSKC